jgi:CelD/BcsL family acetyltransferase involved in cellulose biosynthesis
VPDIDAICLEYNSVLIDPDITLSLESLMELIPITDWDEFHMPRFAHVYCPGLLVNHNMSAKYHLQVTDLGNAYYIDLGKIRSNNMDYLALLSRNRRQQIRRSLREYQKSGEVRLRAAKTVDDALEIFNKLILLHQKEWRKRGKPGAFSSAYMKEFHRNLIRSRFENGEIQLMEFSCGGEPVGCIYNFLHRGHVLFYQSGFNYLEENVFRPGLVCHHLAALHNAAEGFSRYDFLAGESQYKKSLSTGFSQMQDIVVQKRRVKYEIEHTIGNVYRFMKNRTAGAKSAP